MFSHTSVLLHETVDALQIREDGIYVDATAGGGGHSYEIATRLTTGRLICLDRDPEAVQAAEERLRTFQNCQVICSQFSKTAQVLQQLQIKQIDGILFDLGVSSHQLDTARRGFSYHTNAPLDMRMGNAGSTAAELVNTLSAKALSEIFYKYADERFAPRIAQAIVHRRAQQPIQTTAQLAELVADCYPQRFKRDGHPARKVFQALRIAVNDELGEITRAIESVFPILKSGGRIAVITFHSIEDRLVKQQFAALCRGCTCPPDFPVCICGNNPQAKQVFKKPVTAGEQEVLENNRSRSAKLRVIEKL